MLYIKITKGPVFYLQLLPQKTIYLSYKQGLLSATFIGESVVFIKHRLDIWKKKRLLENGIECSDRR